MSPKSRQEIYLAIGGEEFYSGHSTPSYSTGLQEEEGCYAIEDSPSYIKEDDFGERTHMYLGLKGECLKMEYLDSYLQLDHDQVFLQSNSDEIGRKFRYLVFQRNLILKTLEILRESRSYVFQTKLNSLQKQFKEFKNIVDPSSKMTHKTEKTLLQKFMKEKFIHTQIEKLGQENLKESLELFKSYIEMLERAQKNSFKISLFSEKLNNKLTRLINPKIEKYKTDLSTFSEFVTSKPKMLKTGFKTNCQKREYFESSDTSYKTRCMPVQSQFVSKRRFCTNYRVGVGCLSHEIPNSILVYLEWEIDEGDYLEKLIRVEKSLTLVHQKVECSMASSGDVSCLEFKIHKPRFFCKKYVLMADLRLCIIKSHYYPEIEAVRCKGREMTGLQGDSYKKGKGELLEFVENDENKGREVEKCLEYEIFDKEQKQASTKKGKPRARQNFKDIIVRKEKGKGSIINFDIVAIDAKDAKNLVKCFQY